jgi:hypothetical protein
MFRAIEDSNWPDKSPWFDTKEEAKKWAEKNWPNKKWAIYKKDFLGGDSLV